MGGMNKITTAQFVGQVGRTDDQSDARIERHHRMWNIVTCAESTMLNKVWTW